MEEISQRFLSFGYFWLRYRQKIFRILVASLLILNGFIWFKFAFIAFKLMRGAKEFKQIMAQYTTQDYLDHSEREKSSPLPIEISPNYAILTDTDKLDIIIISNPNKEWELKGLDYFESESSEINTVRLWPGQKKVVVLPHSSKIDIRRRDWLKNTRAGGLMKEILSYVAFKEIRFDGSDGQYPARLFFEVYNGSSRELVDLAVTVLGLDFEGNAVDFSSMSIPQMDPISKVELQANFNSDAAKRSQIKEFSFILDPTFAQ